MALPENLQFLRAHHNITQEQLAERLAVSRQSVSKWESGGAYPEMDTLLKLCDLFHIDLDTLLRGDAQQALAEDSAGYDRFMTSFNRKTAGAVAGIIAGAGATAVYVALGLARNMWRSAWIVFAVGGILCGVASILFGPRDER